MTGKVLLGLGVVYLLTQPSAAVPVDRITSIETAARQLLNDLWDIAERDFPQTLLG